MVINKTEVFIENAKKKHGEDRYDYSKVDYVNNKTKVIIICNEHGEFLQSPAVHRLGYGCKYCKLCEFKKKIIYELKKKFIENSIQKYGNMYDYSKVDYVNNRTKVIIICNEHGEFLQSPSNHSSSEHGCYLCGLKKK